VLGRQLDGPCGLLDPRRCLEASQPIPDFEAIADGRQPVTLGLPALLKPFPIEWDRHRTERSS
jgi:hypothetical protein